MKIKRFYEDLNSYFEQNRALIILGPRRVGKTTLLNDFLTRTSLRYKLDSGDNMKTQHVLGSQDFAEIREYAAGYELIAIDEAQRIPAIGQVQKPMVAQCRGPRFLVTGPPLFEFPGKGGEPPAALPG